MEQKVTVKRGGSVEIPLKIYGTRAQTLAGLAAGDRGQPGLRVAVRRRLPGQREHIIGAPGFIQRMLPANAQFQHQPGCGAGSGRLRPGQKRRM